VWKPPKPSSLFLASLLALALSGSVAYGSQFTEKTASNCSFSPPAGDIFGYRISQNEIFDACSVDGTAIALPNQLVISPGIYLLSFPDEKGGTFSRVVNAKKPGVYKFIVPGLGSRQFQVWWPKLGVTRLLTDFSYLYVHGNRDDLLDTEALAVTATKRNISITCGTISNLLFSILQKFQIESRIATSWTLERPNGLDDSHTMLEIRTGKSWALFDPDSRSFFGSKDHKLGVADIPVRFVPSVGKNIQVYGPLMMVDVGGFIDANGSDLSFLEQRSRVSSASLTKWYERVLGVVGVDIDGTHYFKNQVGDDRLQVIKSKFAKYKLVDSKFLRK
jgi:hypothetical protein